MLYGRPPFETRDVKVTYRKIRHNNYTFPSHIETSEASKSFIKSLLRSDPHKRLCLDKIMDHDFFSEDYPARLPASVLTQPPTSTYIAKYTRNPEDPPKPGVSPGKAPIGKDVATFECDLAENDDAQIMSNRGASVQTHRRIESQDKFGKMFRNKEAVSNDRDNFVSTDRLYFNQGLGKGMDSSPY
jgi:serine/threonine protein kinase